MPKLVIVVIRELYDINRENWNCISPVTECANMLIFLIAALLEAKSHKNGLFKPGEYIFHLQNI